MLIHKTLKAEQTFTLKDYSLAFNEGFLLPFNCKYFRESHKGYHALYLNESITRNANTQNQVIKQTVKIQVFKN